MDDLDKQFERTSTLAAIGVIIGIAIMGIILWVLILGAIWLTRQVW